MITSYQLATISYCHDLTAPDANSVPIAVLAVGKSTEEELWSAAIVGVDAKEMGLDPLSSAMLADVPHMIRRHVDGAMRTLKPGATPEIVLRAFHESLKTSIHVSALSGRLEVEVAHSRGLATALIEPALAQLESAIASSQQPAPGDWTPTISPERLMDRAPEQLFWRPVAPRAAVAAL